MPHFLWISLTLSRTMTGRDKIVINMKELKEKKVDSNIIKGQYNNLRSFRSPLKCQFIFSNYLISLISTDNAISIIKKWYNFQGRHWAILGYETVTTILSILKLKPIKCCSIKTDFYGTFYDKQIMDFVYMAQCRNLVYVAVDLCRFI